MPTGYAAQIIHNLRDEWSINARFITLMPVIWMPIIGGWQGARGQRIGEQRRQIETGGTAVHDTTFHVDGITGKEPLLTVGQPTKAVNHWLAMIWGAVILVAVILVAVILVA